MQIMTGKLVSYTNAATGKVTQRWVRTGWKEITSPNIIPAPKEIDRGYVPEAEQRRNAFVHERFIKLFNNPDGTNSFETGVFAHHSRRR